MDTGDKSELPPHIGCKPRLTLDVWSASPSKPSRAVDRIYTNHPQPYQHPDQKIPVFHILETIDCTGYIWGGGSFLKSNKLKSSPQWGALIHK